MPLFDFAMREAKAQGIDPDLVRRVMQQESGGSPNAVSNKGARGAMQLMPLTAKELGVNIDDPHDNIRGGVRYLAQQMQTFKDPRLALAAYNAGPGNVKKYGGIPPFPETQSYVNKIMPNNDDSDIFGIPASKKSSVNDDSDIFVTAKKQASNQQKSVSKQQDIYKETAQKQSTMENLLAGAGGGMYGMYLGAKQLLGKTTPEEIEQHKKAMAGLRSTTAGTVGDIGGQVAASVPAAFIPGANTYVGAGLVGAGIVALQPTTKEGERVNNMATGGIGGVVGNAIGRGIGTLLRPVPRLLDASREAAIKTAERMGMQLTPGEKTGSIALNQVESVLSRTPGSAGMFSKIKDTNQIAINRTAAKSIGENADQLTNDVIARASDRMSKTFNDLSARSNVKLSEGFSGLVKKLENSNNMLGPFRNAQVDDLISKSNELAKMRNIPGNVYQTIRSELTSSADDAFRSGNSGAGRALKEIRDSLDEAAKKGLSKTDQQLWDSVRNQYAHLSTLVKGNVIEGGNVNPRLIKNAMIKFNSKSYKSGKINSQLNDIANISENFKQLIPNSGTPERTAMQSMMFGNPLTGLPMMGAANLYGRAYLSPAGQAYMNKGMVNMSPQVHELLGKSGMLFGVTGGANINK